MCSWASLSSSSPQTCSVHPLPSDAHEGHPQPSAVLYAPPAEPCCVVVSVRGVCVFFHGFSQMKCDPNPDKSPASAGRGVPGSSLWVSGTTPLHLPWARWVGGQPLPGSTGLRTRVPPSHCTPGPCALVRPSWVQGGCRAGQVPRRPGLRLKRPVSSCPHRLALPCGPHPAAPGQSLSCHIPTFLLSLPGTPGSNTSHAERQPRTNKGPFLLGSSRERLQRQNLQQLLWKCLTFPHDFLDILGGQSASSLFEFIAQNTPFSPR